MLGMRESFWAKERGSLTVWEEREGTAVEGDMAVAAKRADVGDGSEAAEALGG